MKKDECLHCPVCGAPLADGMRLYTDDVGRALGCEVCVVTTLV